VDGVRCADSRDIDRGYGRGDSARCIKVHREITGRASASDEELKRKKEMKEIGVPDEFSSLERLDEEGDRTIQ